mmetsp:Transcript_29633/g.95553  ORF Transcript_29633/g.95553 Transcript_29633/m.95553 type:complete len:81 (+) Transcript_29633:3-245(+)
MGHDEGLGSEAASCRYYLADDIQEDCEFAPMLATGIVRAGKVQHSAIVADMSKIDDLRHTSSAPGALGGGRRKPPFNAEP